MDFRVLLLFINLSQDVIIALWQGPSPLLRYEKIVEKIVEKKFLPPALNFFYKQRKIMMIKKYVIKIIMVQVVFQEHLLNNALIVQWVTAADQF